MKLISMNPYTEEIAEEFETLTFEESVQVLIKSRQAFLYWKKVSIRERRGYLRRDELCCKTVYGSTGKGVKNSEDRRPHGL
jgi:hypothetical protein